MKEGKDEKPEKIKHKLSPEEKKLEKEKQKNERIISKFGSKEARKTMIEKEKGPQGYPHSASSSSDVETTDWEDIEEFYKKFHPAEIRRKSGTKEVDDKKESMKDMSQSVMLKADDEAKNKLKQIKEKFEAEFENKTNYMLLEPL